MSLRVASLRRCLISSASSCALSAITTSSLSPSSGSTSIRRVESLPIQTLRPTRRAPCKLRATVLALLKPRRLGVASQPERAISRLLTRFRVYRFAASGPRFLIFQFADRVGRRSLFLCFEHLLIAQPGTVFVQLG